MSFEIKRLELAAQADNSNNNGQPNSDDRHLSKADLKGGVMTLSLL